MSRNCESTCTHSLELDFVNEKFREVLSHNNLLKEQLNSHMFQDSLSVKYLKMCEDLTKVRSLMNFLLSSGRFCFNHEKIN